MAKTCCAEKENKIRSDVNYTKVWMEKLFLFPLYGPLGKDPATKSDKFLEKCQRGGGGFSIQKFILQILGTLVYFTFTLVFEHEIDKKKNNFWVQGMFFQQL